MGPPKRVMTHKLRTVDLKGIKIAMESEAARLV